MWTDALLALALNANAAPAVRAEAEYALTRLAAWLRANPAADPAQRAYYAAAIARVLARPAAAAPAPAGPLATPPGAPIGTADLDDPAVRHGLRLNSVLLSDLTRGND